MKRSTFIATHSIRRHKLAAGVAALLVAALTGPVLACDSCGRRDSRIVCDSGADSGCDSCGSGTPSGPIFKTLDAFAGGIEKFLGLDQCGSTCGNACDACDARMLDESMVPMAPATPPAHHRPEPLMPSVPPQSYSPPAQSYSQPAPVAPGPAPEQAAPVPQPEPDPLPPVENGQQNGGSIFDTLNDPFSNDEVRWAPQKRGSVQPSSHHNRTISVEAMRPRSRSVNGNSTPQRKQTPSHRSYSTGTKRAARRPLTKTTHPSSHQHTTRHQHLRTRQVPLANAPAARRSVNRPTGQRHAVLPVGSYGHPSNRQAEKYLLSP